MITIDIFSFIIGIVVGLFLALIAYIIFTDW